MNDKDAQERYDRGTRQDVADLDNHKQRLAEQRAKAHWDFVDEDGCLHCNCGKGVSPP